jgi:hypothetical protein
LQEIFELPADRLNFTDFYSDKPEDTDRFLCKVLAAGAVAIYLDIITKSNIEPLISHSVKENSTERVIKIFNSFLDKCSGENGEDPANFDPFAHDRGLAGITVDENLRDAYRARARKLFSAFQSKFGVRDCVDILGFDPFSYEDYDEATQEQIESGEWIQKCVDCMQYIIRVLMEVKA